MKMLRRVAPAAALGGISILVLATQLWAGAKTIERPMFNGHRLDWCANWGADCGKPAADAWCLAQGFAGAESFNKASGIGEKSATRLIATGAVCDAAACDGFEQITCVMLDTVEPVQAEAAASSPEVLPGGEADTGQPQPEALPVPETTAAIAPAVPTVGAVPTAETAAAETGPAEPAAMPVDPPPTADSPAVPEAVAMTAAVTDDPGPPPPDTWLLAAAGAPPLKPVIKVFASPTFDGRRLDWCRGWKDKCGKATADEFCQLNGFAAAMSFAPDPKIGATEPTRQIASGLVCDHDECDGFAEIACMR
jgi:hypothetical protein